MKEGPPDSAIRSLIPNHRKLLRSKAVGGERCGKVGTMIPAGWSREVSASEPLQKRRNSLRRCQNRRLALPPGSAREMYWYCPSGIRRVGGTKLD